MRNRPVIVGDEIQKVVSVIVSCQLNNPKIPVLTSVTAVKMSPDLTHATCYMSVFGDQKTKDNCIKALTRASGFVRSEVCKKVRLRVAPEFKFVLDTSMEDASKMMELIDKTIKEDENKKNLQE